MKRDVQTGRNRQIDDCGCHGKGKTLITLNWKKTRGNAFLPAFPHLISRMQCHCMSHPNALAPSTAAFIDISPDTRNFAFPLNIGITCSL